MPPPLAAAAAIKESSITSSPQQLTQQQEEITTSIIETPITNLKIIEQGDEEETSMVLKEEEEEEEVIAEKPTSPLPPPPPQFANETTIAQDKEQEQKQRSRKSSKESMNSIKEGEEEITKVQVQPQKSPEREAERVRVHQDVRRSVSADDKSISSSTTITINQLQDSSNSLANSNGNQVTIVTSHPPVIIDNSQASPSSIESSNKRLSKSLSYDNKLTTSASSSEVIIVSNETNKTKHVHESSTDDDYQSFDSLESSPKFNQINNNVNVVNSGVKAARPRKLDESEVLIVSHDSMFEEDLVDDSPAGLNRSNNQFDTSQHVSVVTVGDDQGGVKVKDSSGHLLIDSNSDLSNVSDGIDNFRSHSKTNGQIIYNSKRSSSSREDDVNIIVQQPNKIKQRISPDSSVDCSSSTGSPTRASRAASENGSMRSDQNVSFFTFLTRKIF